MTDSLSLSNLNQLQVSNAINLLQKKHADVIEAERSNAELTALHRIQSQNFTSLKNQLDTLRSIKSPDTIVSKYLIQVKARSDSLKDLLKLPPQTYEAIMLQQRAQEELNKLPAQVNEKLKLFSEQGASVGLSGFNLPGSLPTDVTVPSLRSSGLTGIQSPGGAMLQINAPAEPALPNLNTDMPITGEMTKQFGEVSNAGKQLREVGKDFKTISTGNLDSIDSKAVETRLAEMAEVPGSGEFTDPVQQAEMLKKWNSDPMYQRELAVTTAKEQAVNHFAGHETQLLSVMEQLSQAKGKVKDVEQVVDLFSKPSNPMKEKTFIERLRPGINLQVQWSQIVLLDINPFVGYRISGRWTTGIGWNDRVGFSSDSYSFSSRDRVYGPRAFVHFKFKESNFIILSPELMHTAVGASTSTHGESPTQWVPGLMGGYRKEFRYSKKMIGTVQFLYNLVAPSGQAMAYTSRLNVLFGFEFPLTKKVKKAPTSPA